MTGGHDAQSLDMINDLPQPWLIVTDLDGTLLDHHSYSHRAVDTVLADLEVRGIPVVFNSSKTFAELVQLREELRNRHPFVVENGSAIYIPATYFPGDAPRAKGADDFECIVLGRHASDIQVWLAEARQSFAAAFVGFGEMSTEELMQATGLKQSEAELAGQRRYSEALRWLDTDAQRERFCREAEHAGFSVLQGGRFLHVLGPCDKGQATRRLAREYEARSLQRYSIIAAGDGDNDVAMLEAADLAVAIRSPVHHFPALSPTIRSMQTREYGPKGWAEAVGQLLRQVPQGRLDK